MTPARRWLLEVVKVGAPACEPSPSDRLQRRRSSRGGFGPRLRLGPQTGSTPSYRSQPIREFQARGQRWKHSSHEFDGGVGSPQLIDSTKSLKSPKAQKQGRRTKSVQNLERWFLSLYASPIDFNTKSAIRFISARVAPFTACTARPAITVAMRRARSEGLMSLGNSPAL